MEQLYALLLLNQSGFEHQEDYLALLHRLFLANPEDGTLLELEICAGNLKASASLLNGYWAERWFRFPVASFRRFLFACVAQAYAQAEDLSAFGRKSYLLWQRLPAPLQREQSFWTLCYADDPLSWGTRRKPGPSIRRCFGRRANGEEILLSSMELLALGALIRLIKRRPEPGSFVKKSQVPGVAVAFFAV